MRARRRLKVVHVVGQLEMGGMEKLLVEFARHTDRGRFCLHFLSLGERGVLEDEIRSFRWPVTNVGARTGVRPWLIMWLVREFWRLGADVVHTHNTRPLLYAGPAARIARVRRVIHTRHGQRFGAALRETAAFRLAARTADRVVCVSHDSAHIARAEGLRARKVLTLWNGIDLHRFGRARPEGAGPVVAVGRLSPEKDFPTLIHAAAIAAREEAGFRLEIAGDGACAGELRQLVCALSLEGVVRLLGQVRDIPSLLSRASIFALPSRTEGISLTILEAMATGLPVISTRVGGNPEVVADEQTGVLVRPGDATALADALLALWRDPVRRSQMGAAGRARAEKYFDVRRMVAAYEALYLNECADRISAVADDGVANVG